MNEKKLRCIAIDDEPLALQLIKNHCSKIPYLFLVGIFEDAFSASEFLKSTPVDLIFIDINMPDISGLEFVRSLENKPMIIFTTAYRNYAVEGFNLEAIDYLLKPLEFPRFAKAAEKAFDHYSFKLAKNREEESIYLYSEYKLVKINLSDIEYIESLHDYIRVHLSNSKAVLSLITMKKVLEKLPDDKFIRIHRSYIIPFRKIKFVANKKVTLSDVVLPVGESYSDLLEERINRKS